MVNEKQLVLDVEEFFNEEDTSVGLYAIWEVNENVVEEFQEVFEGAKIISYKTDELVFELDSTKYKIELKQYYDDAKWVMCRLITL